MSGAAPAASTEATGTAPATVLGAPPPAEDKAAAPQTAVAAEEKTDAAPSADAASPEAKPAEAPAGELELKFPEGMQVDAKMLDGFKAIAKEAGLKPEAAQKIADLYAQQQSAQTKAAEEAMAATQQQWAEALQSDPEIGGAQFETTKALAQKVIRQFGTPELRSFLERTGLGNEPSLVKFVTKVGRAMSEDQIGGTTKEADGPPSEQEFLSRLYPRMSQKE